MDYFIELLSSYIDNENVLRPVFVVLIGLSVFAAITSLVYIAKALFSPVQRRMASIAADDAAGELAERHASVLHDNNPFWDKLDRFESFILPRNEKELSGAKAKLVRAGYRDQSVVKVFYAIKTILGLAFPLIAAQVIAFFPELGANEALFIIFSSAMAGLVLPNIVLSHQEKVRIKAIRRGFPDALDLFVVCVESGLGLAATIQRVAAEMELSHPDLAEELGLVNAEMRLGVDRMKALRGLAERTGLEEIKGLVAMLDQSVRFGTGIAETLRVYADEFRDKRMQEAEEMAAKLGTKIIFPLVLCMWPSFFVVAVGPGVLQVFQAFK